MPNRGGETTRARVDVVVPVFNRAATVDAALESALAQPEVARVIVVDDGSNDTSLERLDSFRRRDQRVVVLRHPGGGNRGPAASRNLGIAHASAPFVAFLDADDTYVTKRFRTSVPRLMAQPGLAAVVEPYRELVAGTSDVRTVVPRHQWIDTRADFLFGSLGRFHTDTVTVRRTVLLRVGGFPMRLRSGEDRVLWWKLVFAGPVRALGSLPVALYQRHPASLTGGRRGPTQDELAGIIAETWRSGQRSGWTTWARASAPVLLHYRIGGLIDRLRLTALVMARDPGRIADLAVIALVLLLVLRRAFGGPPVHIAWSRRCRPEGSCLGREGAE